MSSESPTEPVYVLRRVAPKQWDRLRQEATSAAFSLRAETGISVFTTDKQTPRSLLQKFLDQQQEKYKDNPVKLKNWLESNGATVEELVQKNWRVARVPIAVLPAAHFTLTEPEQDGHQEIQGTAESFDTYGDLIASKSLLCSADECVK